ncbi:hypothetical protein SLS53_003846 [Cytospora paraplurivora]|uniref:C3H1-type domain-containing protein n=1 Tax=Cytospora paraplurivora TaxID=2898453 RepID=A0AAN9U9T0_9PEZI
MSQYPYGYGFQGQQPQQQYSYQPYGAYSAASGYGAQQPQEPQQPQQPPPTTGNYYAATQSAYDYNANNIPGLGAPPAGPLFPVPFNGTWDQSGYGTNSVSAQYPPYIPIPTTSTPASYTNKQNEAPASRDPDPPSQYRQNQSRVQTKAPQIQRLAEEPKQQPKDVDSQEEGEISDSQFDDLYDDLVNQPSDPHPLKVASASGKSSEDGVATGTDQEPNFYETDVEEPPAFKSQPTITSRGKALGSDVAFSQTEPSRVERDRSRSYSPYLSPREVEQDVATPENAKAGSGTHQLAYRGVNNEASARYDQHAGQEVHGADRREEDEVASKGPTAARTSPRPFKTLSEAQNEAKKTILRLLPLGVKYQTYIDEGIDQKVVKDLFVQLNLAPPAPSSTAPEKSITTLEQKTPGPKQQPTETTQADDRAKQQEERKDKIARLLAEKKAKAAAAASIASKAPINPVSTGTSSPSTKPKTQSEKNLLLQQKMEALRKAQEVRAQKANQQPASTQVSKPEVVEKDVARPATQENTATAHSAAGPTSAAAKPAPAAQNLPYDGSGTIPVQPNLGIQSPVLPSPLTKPGTQRKRPVAADFVDYPSPAIKRPFLPSRQDSSLVISVSDDEDDEDDDVDMEVVSPAEDSSASAQQSFNLPRGGPSLRDYPPLTNRSAQRQLSSPAPGTPNGRTPNVDLQAQERAIADLKRKIEEAEARKKAKPKTGSSTPQTPSAGNVTPIDQGAKQSARRAVSTSELDDKNGPSAQLLHEAEAAKLPKNSAASHVDERPKSERQSPSSSAQVPNVTAIDAKVARIKQMEEELKSLRAEVEKTMAEKIRPEVDQPGSDSAADSVAADHQPINAAATPSGDSDRMELDDNSFDAASQSHPMEIESSEESSDEMETVPEKPQVNPPEVLANIATNGVEGSAQDFGSVDPVQPSTAGQSAEAPSVIAVTPPTGHVVSAAEEDASDDYEPPDAQTDDRPAADSPPFSPAPAENASSLEASQREAQDLISPIPMPTQISTATMPNDDPATEAHAEFFSHPSSRVEEISREDAGNAAPTPQTSFVDYESPLRYFHAYRFHPAYNHSVAGGLKSLTYSNRIDPKREVCPDELDGQNCPRGSACQFQHFQNMTAPDNLIILELGSSDDLIGDQKKNFNNGLRELVSSFQKSKVRDFKTIAEGIVEFRRRFLGDPTRILHLEGVTI